MRFPRSPILAALALAALPLASNAQVKVSLVASESSVQPGRPFTVALHLVQEEGWHTYWINPGTGLATTLAWALPPGWKAGDIRWPAPHILKDAQGNIVGNGYEGRDVLLPVTIMPPADAAAGAPVELKATADWLMCKDECMPGESAVSLVLPVSPAPPAPDSQWGEKIRAVAAELPSEDADWAVSATRRGKAVTLTVSRSGPGGGKPVQLHFFSDDNLIGYELPQGVADDGKGGFVLTLAISPDGPENAKWLSGVLTGDGGWRADGTLPALRIHVPFTGAEAARASGAAAAATPTSPPPGTAGEPAMGATLLLAFLGGLILNLMPCVFPVLGIKVLGFVNQAGTERKKVVSHGVVFTAGVVLSFWVLAGLLEVLRRGGQELGWGFQLQSPGFVFALAAVMLVFALNLSGVFEFGLTATAIGSDLQMKSGFAGSFFTGVLATVVATPCSAPFLAPALGAALTLSLGQAFAVFTAIAIGLSTPYLLLSIFPAAVRVLPRPGAWMETFKELMAFPLYASVGYLLWVLAGQVQEWGLLNAFFGLVLTAMGAWCYGRWHGAGASPGRARFGLLACIALGGLGLWTGWPQAPSASDIIWEKWSPDSVSRLRADGRIVYVDFTARWCATCQANKKLVFHSDDVLRAFGAKHIATLRGDWTNRDPAITEELSKYHRSAVPFNLIWFPGKTDPVILPELLTPATVLDALSRDG